MSTRWTIAMILGAWIFGDKSKQLDCSCILMLHRSTPAWRDRWRLHEFRTRTASPAVLRRSKFPRTSTESIRDIPRSGFYFFHALVNHHSPNKMSNGVGNLPFGSCTHHSKGFNHAYWDRENLCYNCQPRINKQPPPQCQQFQQSFWDFEKWHTPQIVNTCCMKVYMRVTYMRVYEGYMQKYKGLIHESMRVTCISFLQHDPIRIPLNPIGFH